MDLDLGGQEEEEAFGQQNPPPNIQEGEGVRAGAAKLPGLMGFWHLI